MQQALVPLGEKIVELANVVLPPLVAIITAVSEVFGMLPEPVQNFVVILGALLVAFTALTPVIAALAVSFGALNISLLPVIGIIAGVAAAIAGIIAIVKNWGAITEWFGNLWQSVFQKLMELWNGLVVFFTETIPAAFQTFIGFFFCHPGLVERPVVTGIRIFHEYLERDPAESHCPAGSDNDYFFVGEREKYPAGHLVGDL